MNKDIYKIIYFYDINHFKNHKNKFKPILNQLIQIIKFKNYQQLNFLARYFNANRIASGLSLLHY